MGLSVRLAEDEGTSALLFPACQHFASAAVQWNRSGLPILGISGRYGQQVTVKVHVNSLQAKAFGTDAKAGVDPEYNDVLHDWRGHLQELRLLSIFKKSQPPYRLFHLLNARHWNKTMLKLVDSLIQQGLVTVDDIRGSSRPMQVMEDLHVGLAGPELEGLSLCEGR